jgi:excisionase family DNA binding protein
MNTPQTIQYMTELEVAALFSVSRETIRKWRKTKGLPHLKIGHRTLRSRRVEVDAWAAKWRLAMVR